MEIRVSRKLFLRTTAVFTSPTESHPSVNRARGLPIHKVRTKNTPQWQDLRESLLGDFSIMAEKHFVDGQGVLHRGQMWLAPDRPTARLSSSSASYLVSQRRRIAWRQNLTCPDRFLQVACNGATVSKVSEMHVSRCIFSRSSDTSLTQRAHAHPPHQLAKWN